MIELDIFIPGETIDLRIPTREFAAGSEWYAWFNDPLVTRYLDQGPFPNTRADQEAFFLEQRDQRLILIIVAKDGEVRGTVSLSRIDLVNKSCEIALVASSRAVRHKLPLANLEAMARIGTHAFESLGMLRISAGQHFDLRSWQQRLELIGYRLEGLHFHRFRKAHHVADTMSINCAYEDYLRLKEARGGHLWDGLTAMQDRISRLPAQSYRDRLQDFRESVGEAYYDEVFRL